MLNSNQKIKGWLYYATLFHLPIDYLWSNENFIDIYTDIEGKNPFNTVTNGIYVVLNYDINQYENLANIFSLNKLFKDYTIFIEDKQKYSIYYFELNNFISENYVNDIELIKLGYNSSFMKFDIFSIYAAETIFNCGRLNYNFKELYKLPNLKNVLKLKGSNQLPFFIIFLHP